MKILVLANQVPFLPGGADYHVEGLLENLKKRDHETVCLRFPFDFSSYGQMSSLMEFCESQDMNYLNGVKIDRLISMQFPAWGVQHNDHRSWVMHQHRVAYELYDQQPKSIGLDAFRSKVHDFDNRALKNVNYRFANSFRVASRLNEFNKLDSTPLYHPPYADEHFYCEDAYDYIFCPSRLVPLKRQDLLIEAAKYLETPVHILIAGDGSLRDYFDSLIHEYGLEQRVKLLGRIDEKDKLGFYARSMAVFFAPFDEDYGYVTLEAMLSSKPVITTLDAGGPLEFVTDGENGYVLEPDPKQIAACIDEMYRNKQRTKDMGLAGRESYWSKEISWQNVVDTLLQ